LNFWLLESVQEQDIRWEGVCPFRNKRKDCNSRGRPGISFEARMWWNRFYIFNWG
jgi:hypothetical protein